MRNGTHFPKSWDYLKSASERDSQSFNEAYHPIHLLAQRENRLPPSWPKIQDEYGYTQDFSKYILGCPPSLTCEQWFDVFPESEVLESICLALEIHPAHIMPDAFSGPLPENLLRLLLKIVDEKSGYTEIDRLWAEDLIKFERESADALVSDVIERQDNEYAFILNKVKKAHIMHVFSRECEILAFKEEDPLQIRDTKLNKMFNPEVSKDARDEYEYIDAEPDTRFFSCIKTFENVNGASKLRSQQLDISYQKAYKATRDQLKKIYVGSVSGVHASVLASARQLHQFAEEDYEQNDCQSCDIGEFSLPNHLGTELYLEAEIHGKLSHKSQSRYERGIELLRNQFEKLGSLVAEELSIKRECEEAFEASKTIREKLLSIENSLDRASDFYVQTYFRNRELIDNSAYGIRLMLSDSRGEMATNQANFD